MNQCKRAFGKQNARTFARSRQEGASKQPEVTDAYRVPEAILTRFLIE
jgi:hypothetical protein